MSTARRMLACALLTTLALIALCGTAAGQLFGPYAPYTAPVTVAGPGVAIASVNGVTAVAAPGGAIASAGPVTAGASALFPSAFAGLANPWPAYYGLGLGI